MRVQPIAILRAEIRLPQALLLLSLFTDFENFSVFKPASQHENSVNALFDQVIAWGGALKTLRILPLP